MVIAVAAVLLGIVVVIAILVLCKKSAAGLAEAPKNAITPETSGIVELVKPGEITAAVQ